MYFRPMDEAAALAAGLAAPELTRRQFLNFTTLAGSGLTLGVLLPGCAPHAGPAAKSAATRPLAMPFVRIAPDNTVTVICKHVEAGQGVWTGLPAIVAEELDAAWSQMRVESAPAQVPHVRQPRLRAERQRTGHRRFDRGRQLLDAAAPGRRHGACHVGRRCGQELERPGRRRSRVSDGVVAHAGAAKRATFGELAAAAAEKPVPTEVKLKDPATFKVIGTRQAAAAGRARQIARPRSSSRST